MNLMFGKKLKTLFFIEKKYFYLFSLPIILIILLSVLVYFNDSVKNYIENNNLPVSKIPSFSASLYPYASSTVGLKSSNAYAIEDKTQNKDNASNISAESFVVIDDDSKVVLLSKNDNLRFSMASTTKIMTALTALDYYKLNDILTIKTATVEGSIVGFKEGEKFKFEDILYAMLLPSGNDAALAIAQNYPSGEIEFINRMNEKAASFNLYNTHFSEPSGIEDEGDYTTVIDLARLSSVAMKNSVLSKIVGTKEKIISDINGKEKYKLNNLNKLLGLNGINGIKTGFTEEAGGVLTTSRIDKGHRIIIVVMRSEDRFVDTQKLVSLINGKINYVKVDNH